HEHYDDCFGGGMRLSSLPKFLHFATLLVVLMVLCGYSSATFAQGIATGSLSATVTDASGASVPDVDVTAQNIATGQLFTGKTNGVGYVELRTVPPGGYKVTVTSKAFRKLEVSRTEVAVAQNTDLGDLKLEIGAASETVQVEGVQPLIEASTSQVTSSFGSAETADLPLNGGFDILTLFVPGVADSGSNS